MTCTNRETLREKRIKEKMFYVFSTTKIKFKNEEARERWDEIDNISPIVYFMRRWAKYMQYLTENRRVPLHRIVLPTAELTNDLHLPKSEIHQAAIELCSIWKYGDELAAFMSAHPEAFKD